MKRIFVSTILVLLFAINSIYAQRDNAAIEERVKSIKVAFITDKLALTPEESQVFWPIYNQYQVERKTLRKQGKRTRKMEDLSDAEIEQEILKMFDLEAQELALKKEYFGKLKPVLPIKKIAKLQRVERDFKQQLVRRMGDRESHRKKRMEH